MLKTDALSNQNPALQRQVLRRIAPLIVGTFLVFGVLGTIMMLNAAYNRLKNVHQTPLSLVVSKVQAELDTIDLDMRELVSSEGIRELTYSYANLKDLKKVKKKGYNLNQILVIDDTPKKLSRNYGNHIKIKPFVGDPNDQELLLLEKYLITLKSAPNVRTIEKRGWQNTIISK